MAVRDAPLKIRPLLRWAGGKQALVDRLLQFCPKDHRNRAYVEPFLGAASLFLALRPEEALLADANRHLISTYRHVRDDPDSVSRHLQGLASRHSEIQYYKIRDEYNRSPTSRLQAARFLYLNRTCFNGIFRVNRKGVFNVPHGRKKAPWFPNYEALTQVGDELRKATLLHGDYTLTLNRARKGDFVYLDPPYPALNGTSYFTHYTMDRFGEPDQVELALAVRELDRRRCLFMMSNADTPLVRRLYAGFALKTLDVTRYVTCKAVRHRVQELVITNY